jgi:hypothetical protein
MSTVPYPPQRQLSVGEVLDLTFRIYRATFVKCLLFATCGVVAGQLAGIYALAKGRTLPQGSAGVAGMLAQMQDRVFDALYIVGLVLTLIFYAAVILRQRAIITDGPVGGELTAALRRTPALIGLLVLVVLACAPWRQSSCCPTASSPYPARRPSCSWRMQDRRLAWCAAGG